MADFFVDRGYSPVRFGQLTLDEVVRRGLPVTEANEKMIREGLRKEHGMAAFAILNLPHIEELRAAGEPILLDGLYSWSEYKLLKEKYGKDFFVIAVYAPPTIRYERLQHRASRHGDDTTHRHRSIAPADAQARDYAEIENIEKAGPIAMADFTIMNTGTLEDMNKQLADITKQIG